MSMISFQEIRLIVANSASENYLIYPKEKLLENSQKYESIRVSLIKTLKTYVKKYYQSPDKYNILYLSIAYLDIILSKNRITLFHDKNLKYLCLCCFLLSLKFIGNYNSTKKIISNFCKNYKHEYKIFEIQCLMLLEHNLSYTTVYDYLNMITMKEDKRVLGLCNYYLYQLCEDKTYTFYPPFYISIAIYQLVKNNTNNINRNHYDKYFKDERVKILVKKFNDIINPSIINDLLNIVKNNNDDNNNESLKHTMSNQSLNFFTNNNIQNNIFIINTYSKNNEDKNDISINNHSKLFLENNQNNTPRKIMRMLTGNFEKNAEEYNYSAKSNGNFFSRSSNGINRLTNYNINYSLLNRITMRQNKKKSNYEITSYKTTNNKEDNGNSFCEINSSTNNNYKNNTIQIKKNVMNKDNYLYNNSTFYIRKNGDIINNEKNNTKEKKTKHILNNKSSLNFQLVYGVSKEKLLKLSRNISKTIIKTYDGNN